MATRQWTGTKFTKRYSSKLKISRSIRPQKYNYCPTQRNYRMEIYNVSDVFNESEIPVLTFVEPKEFNDLVGSLLTSGKHVTLSGPSGCGKTTLAKKTLVEAEFGPGNTHWLSGRDYSNAPCISEIFQKEFACDDSRSLFTQNLDYRDIVYRHNTFFDLS